MRRPALASTMPDLRPDQDPALADDLLDDVVAMTRQAAVDGLPLAAVIADLRLVLDLDPSDDVPARVLRECALAWAAVQQDLAASSSGAVTVRTWHELESHWWGLLGSGDGPLPGWVVLVDAGTPRPDESAAPPSALASVLGPADHLRGAARVLADLLDRPGDDVSLLRHPAAEEPHRVVALVAESPGGEPLPQGAHAEDRATTARARLAAHPWGGHGALVVSVHSLGGHPEGMLGMLRDVVEQSP